MSRETETGTPAEFFGGLAEQMVPAALALVQTIHHGDQQAALTEALAGLAPFDDTQVRILAAVLAAMVDPDRSPDELLAWLDDPSVGPYSRQQQAVIDDLIRQRDAAEDRRDAYSMALHQMTAAIAELRHLVALAEAGKLDALGCDPWAYVGRLVTGKEPAGGGRG